MALEGNIPHLINGVSRQVDAMRLPTHLEEQINRLSHPATGNQRRPGSVHRNDLSWSYSGEMFYHEINRDSAERYHVLIANGDLKVYDKVGNEKTVAFPNGKAYLASVSPRASFAAATSADYTFITNKGFTVDFDATQEPALVNEALVFVRAVNYNRRLKIIINGSTAAEYITPDSTSTDGFYKKGPEQMMAPAEITKALFWGDVIKDGSGGAQAVNTISSDIYTYVAVTGPINGWAVADADGAETATCGGYGYTGRASTTRRGASWPVTRLIDNLNPSTWSVVRYNNVLHIKRVDGAAFTISTETDKSQDKDNLTVIRDSIQDFADLPNNAPNGYKVRVTGTPSSSSDDYWVKFNSASKTWEECPAFGVKTKFDPAKMPHILVREADGTFTFKRATWVDRKVGDAEEDLSFIGAKINDIVFHRGRMAFLTEESIVMTRASEFFDFWRTTMTAVLDDDPIDVSGTSDNVAIFKYGVSYDEDLYLFADQSVHRLVSGDLLTPKSVAIPPAVKAQVNVNVTPVSSSRSILFAGAGLTYGDIRECFIATDTDEVLNVSVSDHATNYIPSDIRMMADSPKLNMTVIVGSSNELFFYQYYWAGSEKLQAAIHKWQLAGATDVVGVAFFDDELHALVRSGSTITLETFDCAAKQIEGSESKWSIRIDRKVFSTNLAAPTGTTNKTYTLPYTVPSNIKAYRFGGDQHGLPLTVVSYAGNTVTLQGDTSGFAVVFGVPFTSTMELSRIYLTQVKGQRDVIINNEDLRLLRVWFHVDETAWSKAYVQTYADGPIFSSEYSSFTINDARFNVNRIYLNRGRFSLPIKAKSERVRIWLENDTHLPDTITGLEWLGEFDPRGKRV